MAKMNNITTLVVLLGCFCLATDAENSNDIRMKRQGHNRRNNRNQRPQNTRSTTPYSDQVIYFPDDPRIHKSNQWPPLKLPSHMNTRSNNETGELLDLARRLNEVTNIEDFVSDYSEDYDIESRFGAGDFTALAPFAKQANCVPEMTVVSTINTTNRDPALFYLPMCTRVLRCGGCCNNALLQCEAVSKIMKTFRIYQLNRAKNPITKKMIEVSLEEHTQCKCGCIVKEKDCSSGQIYMPKLCRCICLNFQEEQLCNRNDLYQWDSDTCRCKCIDEIKNCSTGTYFNHDICRCTKR